MKRLLISLLVLSLVLWTVSVAFAAGFSDTKGTKYEGAVETLSTLGLLAGFPDGTFRPGDTITRAQFCAVAVRALGLENAAEYAAGATIFPDVPATHWAAGYINIAVDQGICKGFPDGTFRPEAPVTYVEALAMLVRVLGYEPAVKGSWPTNYLVKSFELGMSKGVTFSAGAPATRGDVARFTNNCLEIDLMEQTVVGDNVEYKVVDKTLLDSRLGYEAVTGVVTETGDVLNTTLDSDEAVIDDGVAATDDKHELAKGVNLTAWIGYEVKAWLNGDTVILAKKVTPDSSVTTDTIKDTRESGTKKYVKLTTPNKEYLLDNDAVVYWNFLKMATADVGDAWNTADVTVVFDEENVIVALLVLQYEGSYLLSKTDVDDEEVYVIDKDGNGPTKIELGDFEAVKFVKDGAEVDLKDLELWDVAQYAKYDLDGDPDGDEVLYFELIDEKVSGELKEIGLDKNDNLVLTVGTKDYTVADASYSEDNNKTFDDLDEDTAEDFAGQDVTVYLDKYGDVRHMVASLKKAAAPATTGLILKEFYEWGPPGDEEYFAKLLTSAGKKVTYKWTSDTKFAPLDDFNTGDDVDEPEDGWDIATLNDCLEVHTVVSFSLDSDGLLAKVTELDFDDPEFDLDEDAIDAKHNTLKIEGKTCKATASTVIFDEVYEEDGDKEHTLTWDTFEELSSEDTIPARAFRDGDSTIDVLVVDTTDLDVTYPGVADTGIVLKRVVTADGTAFKILVEDKSSQYLAEDATVTALVYGNWTDVDSTELFTDIDVGDLIEFELSAAGDEFTEITELDAAYDEDGDTWYRAYINEGGIDEDNLIISVRYGEDKDDFANDDFDIVLTDDTLIYDATGTTPELASFSDLEEDLCIQFFDVGDEPDGLIEFVKIIKAPS